VTEEIPATHELDDAKLLNLVRAGDAAAFAVLRQRHEQAARRLAGELVLSPAEVDDVVGQTFAQVLGAALRGGGPTDAFRPYLLTAVRRVCYDRLQGQRRQLPMERQLPGPGQPSFDTAEASPDRSLMARAFLSLPERWSAVLWHTEIERSGAAEVAPVFGLTRHGIAALHRRAKDSLRQGYLQMHMACVTRQACKPTAARLGAFVLDALSKRETTLVSEHLSECDECQAVCAELSDINGALRSQVAPIFLGSAAASYLATEADSPTDSATGLPGASEAGTEAADGEYAIGVGHRGGPEGGGGTDGSTWALGKAGVRRSIVVRWAAGAAAAIVAVSGFAFAVILTGSPTPTGSGHRPQPGTTALPVTLSTPGLPGASKSAQTRAGRSPSMSPSQARSPAASSSPSAGTQPAVSTPQPRPDPAASAQLAASVGVHGGHSGKKARVVFQVSDAGSAATGELTVTVTLPAGTSMIAGHPGHTASDSGDGWSCQPDSTGAICQRAAVQAGSQTGGVIFIIIVSSSSACGQPVQLSATDGSVSASAQSPSGIPCGRAK
jgi:RNA polymerase sigma factor (sigma-70 family)